MEPHQRFIFNNKYGDLGFHVKCSL
jgi:hypothetical protein